MSEETGREETRLETIQREHLPWRQRNFPMWRPHQPLEGVVEELGEFIDCDEACGPCEADAVGDCIIFMADVCNARGFSLQGVYDRALTIFATTARCSYSVKGSGALLPTVLLSLVGRLLHEQLKLEQQIRGTEAEHLDKLSVLLSEVLVVLLHYGQHDLEECAWETWKVVRARDWVAERAMR